MNLSSKMVIKSDFTSKDSEFTSFIVAEDSNYSVDKSEKGKTALKKYWNKQQQACFIQFWLLKFINYPFNNYSFDAPLKRSQYSKELSRFIESKLGKQQGKTYKECKSKFSTIKRRVKDRKGLKKIQKGYGFIDYIIQHAKELKQLRQLLGQLIILMESKSQFMKLNEKIVEFEESEAKSKNDQIEEYLKVISLTPNL